jgi:HAD superfamily hydrolase (TIGR01509 family)
MIRALVFDFDGVILDTETPFFRSWQEIYQESGFDLSMQDWASMLGSFSDPEDPYEQLEDQLGIRLDREAIRSRRSDRESELLASEEILPGVEAVMLEGRRLGLRLAVASSSDRNWVTTHLERLNLLSKFDIIMCAEDVEFTKPFPDLYEAVLLALNIQASQAIAFEDTLNGVLAAKRAGLYCVAIPNTITHHSPMPEADMVVQSLQDVNLEELVKKLNIQS